ncbi:MAG TPA: hypothetical protein ENJ56_03125 [Anaerolineae bacterium]|nr:hypothetical protein [Anaerolineae bacterium]
MNFSQLVIQQAGSRAVKDRASFHIAACVTAFGVLVSQATQLPAVYVTICATDERVSLPLTLPVRESFGRISQRIRTATRGSLPLFVNSFTLLAHGYVLLCEQGPSGRWYFSADLPPIHDKQKFEADFSDLLEQGLQNPLKPLDRLISAEQTNLFQQYLCEL